MSADIIIFPKPLPPPDPLDCPVAVSAVKQLLEFISHDHDRGKLRALCVYEMILDGSIST